MPRPTALVRLEADGLVVLGPDGYRTTRRWHGAMARAAIRLYRSGAPWDLRLPIAGALLERYPELRDDELAALVEALLPLEEVTPARRDPDVPGSP